MAPGMEFDQGQTISRSKVASKQLRLKIEKTLDRILFGTFFKSISFTIITIMIIIFILSRGRHWYSRRLFGLNKVLY